LLEAELARQDIAYVKYGGLKFVESAHVKDLMSFLRLAENPRDRVAGKRVLTLLAGVGPKKAMQLLQALSEADGDFAAWSSSKPPVRRTRAVSRWPDGENSASGTLCQSDSTVRTLAQPKPEAPTDRAKARPQTDTRAVTTVRYSFPRSGDGAPCIRCTRKRVHSGQRSARTRRRTRNA